MIKLRLCIALLCAALLALTGCAIVDDDDDDNGGKKTTAGEVTGTSPTPSADLQEIAARVDAVLALGYNTLGTTAVYDRLSADDPDLFVVDTREPADFAEGHIPGAINIPLQELPSRLLDGTHGIPMDTDVVVASYWGNDGNMGSLLINLYRIADPSTPDAYPISKGLFQGMTSWSYDRELVPADSRFEDAQAAGLLVEEETETTANDGTDHDYPTFAAFDAETDEVVEKILVRADRYLNSVADQLDLQVYPSAVADMLAAGDSPQIISVRGGAHYAAGHIPSAVNVPYKSVADLDDYSKFVDPTKTAYVYCYTGHTGSLSTLALGILGYDAVNILYGMNGWTQDSAVASGQLGNFDQVRGWDFPLHDLGDGLDTLAAYDPPSQGCEGCHVNLTAIYTDLDEDPPEGVATPPSSGEG